MTKGRVKLRAGLAGSILYQDAHVNLKKSIEVKKVLGETMIFLQQILKAMNGNKL